MSETPERPSHVIVVLVGHPGSGKSALAATLARSVSPPGLIVSVRDVAKKMLAHLACTRADNFAHPRAENVMFRAGDGTLTSFNEALDDFYDSTRVALPWFVWVAHLRNLIDTHLTSPTGARFFIVDDLVHYDECEYVAQLPGATAFTVFLDGNPGKAVPRNKTRPAYHTREDIRDKALANYVGVFRFNTDLPLLECESRLLKFVTTCINITPQQRANFKIEVAAAAAAAAAQQKQAAEDAAAAATNDTKQPGGKQ